ncbi:MAG TPA: ABC transporter permease, partial [Candidatus Limnocylindria bacterium]|nr:ABC transporter permease [Candidatus Limnocylindria bacterium]
MVAKRTAHDWLIAAAASLIILLATTLLSAGLIYSGAVSQSGLRRSLLDADAVAANVAVAARMNAAQYATADAVVRSELAWSFEGIGVDVVGRGESDAFGLPGQAADADVTDLATLASYEQIEEHASLMSGTWPAAGSAPVEVAVSSTTAALLDWSVGDELDLANRRDETFHLPIRIAGIFQPDDLTDAFWRNDPLLLNGVTETSSYRTFGPLVVEPQTFRTQVALPSGRAEWLAFPAFNELRIDQIGSVGGRVTGLQGRIEGRLGDKPKLEVATRLPEILRDADRSLLVARTGVLILTVQLAVLAGYALLLTAGLLIDQRRVETALLRSRGASTNQVATLALMEGVLLALPAVLIGPWLAAASLRILNAVGPLAEIRLDLEPQVSMAAYLLAAIAGAACIVSLVFPAFTSARSLVDAAGSRGRQQRRGVAQRAGLDLALLAVAAIGFWQLRHYGGSITASVQGQIGLDPFLVAAPAIGLLAGAVLALRLIPLLAQLLDRAVGGTRGLVTSLGAWQVARRPLRYTRSALLLMLAIALGVFAVSYSRTWTDSQNDQAAFQVGADIAVTPDIRSDAIPGSFLAAAYQSLDGVESLTPVSRRLMHLSRTTATGTLLALDADRAGGIVDLRADMTSQPLTTMLSKLTEDRPDVHLLALPGEPQRVRLDVQVTIGGDEALIPDQPFRSVDVLASVV